MTTETRITTNPNQCGGAPCIRGQRIRVRDVLDLLDSGVSRETILEDFPSLEDEDITACLEFMEGGKAATPTPRTDAVSEHEGNWDTKALRMTHHARQLERELASFAWVEGKPPLPELAGKLLVVETASRDRDLVCFDEAGNDPNYWATYDMVERYLQIPEPT